MSRARVIIDCYTDEPAGLGVPPFLGTWPRYIAGSYRDFPTYLTIDDVRLASYQKKITQNDIYSLTGKTRIDLINNTRSVEETREILKNASQAIIISGMQTPGKYISAEPGTIEEITKLLKNYNIRKIITGPAASTGTQQFGGKYAELPSYDDFDEIKIFEYSNYEKLQEMSIKGAAILKQIPQPRILEIETGRGCTRAKGCRFCTEPLKNRLEWRDADLILGEIEELQKYGAKYFRLGKQSCIYSYQNCNDQKLEYLLKNINALNPNVLHIDNANPQMVTPEKTKLFVQYLTPGSTAAMGMESFDPKVIKENNLNSSIEATYEAVKIINSIGRESGENGCAKLLPGINIILGLKAETEETLELNFKHLKQFLDDDLLIRRINIRQVVPFPGTDLYNTSKFYFLNKNKKFYKKWIEKVRHEIDNPMLQKVFPLGTILKDLYSVSHEGNVTFLRQFGSYPIIVGIKKRLPLGERFNTRIIGHNLRSLEGAITQQP